MKISLNKFLIVVIFIIGFLHLFRLDYPHAYVFDEVYHAFTARQYLIGDKQAWNPFATPPKGVAFEWTHPPLAKELMTTSMFITKSQDGWAYRLPGALLGILSLYLIYQISLELFGSTRIALLSTFAFSLDGLNFVQSRTGMNDIYFVTFMLASVLFFLRKRFPLSAIFLGFSLASKWAAIYLLGFYIILLVKKYASRNIIFFLTIPVIIYLLSYIPYFAAGYDIHQFIELQKQMWWYHTNLKATHDYASPWWSWPLNLYPVWYYVEYAGNKLGNIFASGNPILFWVGAISIIFTIKEFLKTRSEKLLVIILGYFAFWLPWAISPRIMFLYHYSASIPFLCLSLGYQLNKLYQTKQKNPLLYLGELLYSGFYFLLGYHVVKPIPTKKLDDLDLEKQDKFVISLLILILLGFIVMYPFLTGILLPKDWLKFFFATNLTKNPFGG